MSHTHDSDHEIRPAGEEHAHHTASEIREEIKHAVEHVPKPVRWTVKKLVLLVSASVVALLVVIVVTALLYLSNRTEWVAKELTVFLNTTLAQRSDVTVQIADVRGNLLRDVRLIRPRVVFRDGQGPPILEAPEMRVRYSTWALLRGGRSVDIDVDSPVIRLARLPDGRLRLPTWRASGKPPKRPAVFDVRLRIKKGRLVTPEQKIEQLAADASASLGRGTRLLVREVTWKEGLYDTRNLKLSGEMAVGDSVFFMVRELRAEDLVLTARGRWKKGSPVRVIHADVEKVRWQWLARATNNRTFDVPGEGRATIDATADNWALKGHFTTHLTWSDLPVQGTGAFTWGDGQLTVDPMFAGTPAGNLRGRALWSKRGWEVGGQVQGGNSAKWGALGIHDWPEGNLNGEFLYAVVSGPESRAHLTARLGASEMVRWRADAAQVEIEFPKGGPNHFTVDMQRLGGRVQLEGDSQEGGWQGTYVATSFPLEEWPDGKASGIHGVVTHAEGTVAGHGGELHVTGELSGVTTDWLGARMARWKLHSVEGRLLPTPDLGARARLEDVMFLATHLDSVDLGLRLGNQTVALGDVAGYAGDTLITAAGNASWSPGTWRMTLDRAEAKSPQFHWVAEPPVELAGDPRGVMFERFVARDRDSRFEFAGRWGVPGGFYDWTARAQGLELARLGLPKEWLLGGKADVAVEVHGPAERPEWTLEATSSAPVWQGHKADSLVLSVVGTPNAMEVRRATAFLGGGTLTLEGRVTEARTPTPDSLTAQALIRWLGDAGRWKGSLAAKSLPLERLSEWTRGAAGWSGRVSGVLAIDGSPSRPILKAQVSASPLAWQTYRVDDFKARAEYRDGRLEVPEIHMTRGSLVSTVSGAMPLRLALGARPQVPEEPMSWRLSIPNGDLAVLPLFVQQIGSASGKFELSADVGGTPKKPDLNGSLKVREGELRMAGREEVLQRVSASGTLDESRLTLDSLTARQGDRGRVSARGVVEISGNGIKSYNFDLKMREFTAIETGLYAAEFDGDFKVTDGPRMNRQILPHVEGNMALRRAVILFDFANQSEVQRIAATTQPLFWTYRVHVDANNNLHWQPPDGDIEFSADLSLEQTLDQLIIYGEMKALRGTYYFLSNRFTVKQADLTFDNLKGVDPIIAAEATTRVVPSGETSYALGAGTDQAETHEVTVAIRGRSSEPVIEFRSVPNDWDEARVLRELTVGRFYAGGVTLGDPLDNYLTRAINKTLSSEMSRAFRGYINEWALDRERGGLLAGEGDVILGVGTQITPNLQLRYRQRVPGTGHQTVRATDNLFERDFEAEYRLNRFFYVTSELTQRRALGGVTTTASGGPEFNVNLKARWEY